MKIILSGATGAMGKVISDLLSESKEDQIVCGIGIPNGDSNFPIYENFEKITENADMIIDFSLPELTRTALKYAVSNNIPLVIATTGLTENDFIEIENASKVIPILQSGNMSLGIHVLINLVKLATKNLKGFDKEIIDIHHNKKVDSPSGTANMIANAIKNEDSNITNFLYGREGNIGKRTENEVGIHSIRGGTVVGEHTVGFYGLDEIIEIKHTALSKRIFAKGAIECAHFLINQPAKLYRMDDIFS